MAKTPQEISGRQAARTSSDDRHFVAGVWCHGNIDLNAFIHYPVGTKPLQLVDGYRIICQRPPAGIFTWMRTDAAARKRQGIPLHNGKIGLIIFLAFYVPDVFWYIDLSRAGLAAWCQPIGNKVHMKNAF